MEFVEVCLLQKVSHNTSPGPVEVVTVVCAQFRYA